MARILLIALMLLSLSAVAHADETRRFKSRSYDITTDLPEEQARFVADHMDAVHREYATRFNAYGNRNNEPLRLWVFATRTGYAEFLAGFEIDAIGSGGMFFRRSEASGLISYLGKRGMDSMLETLRHEGMHQFLYQRIGDGLPQWLNEGMGEWFGYALPGQRGFEMGLADPGAIDRIRDNIEKDELIPLEDLLTMTRADWNERVQTGVARGQYDQSWSLVHFLAFGERGKYAPLLDQMLRLLWQGYDAEPATKQVFGDDLGAMETAWHEYLGTLEPDELYLAIDSMTAHAMVLGSLHGLGAAPTDPAAFNEAIDANRDQIELPEFIMTSLGERRLDLDADAWWRTLPNAARTGRAPTMRMIPDRRGKNPPGIELRGLKRRVILVWSRDDESGLEHAVTLR